MKLEVKVPSVGESVTQAELETWEKSNGDFVKKGEILAVLETDKASMEIPAESDGTLSILKQKGETVSVGDVIAIIDSSQKGVATKTPVSKKETFTRSSVSTESKIKSPKTSPSVRHLAGANQIDVKNIKPSQQKDRLTKQDVLSALNQPSHPKTNLNMNMPKPVAKGQRREAMSNLRKRTAERLVQSQHATATLSTFNEIDMSRIMELRQKHQDRFVKKYGIKLGFMSFFVKAVSSALKVYPKLNAFIDETDLVYNDSHNIGVAVGTEKGLVVPVIFNSEDLSLADIEKQILIYKDKANTRKLTPDDLFGGTFTISNGGVFGSLLSTPILNPPQSGILGMHKIEKRPIVVDDQIEIRPMMYLTLSYDHRIVDGRESVGFLVKVKEGLEEPASLVMDI